MTSYLLLAIRNLLQARRRTLLLSTALALVSTLLVVLLALSAGLSESIMTSATTLMSGHVNVGGFYKAKPSDAYPMVTKSNEIRRVVSRALDGVALITDRARGWGKIISDSASQQVGMSGVDILEERGLVDRIQLAKESEYREGGRDEILGRVEGLADPGTAMIFVAQAKRLGVTVGDRLTISTESMTGSVNTVDVHVVAVAKDIGFMSTWSLFVPKSVLRELYQLNEDTTGAVMIYLEDVEDTRKVVGTLLDTLGEAGFELMDRQPVPFWRKMEVVSGEDWTGQKLDVTTWEDEVGLMSWAVSALDSISYFLVAILLVIIIVGIMNTMWIAVRERTGEIGTLRAIGMQRLQVMTLFLVEAALLGVFATTVGAALGAALAMTIDAAGWQITSDAMRAVLMADTLNFVVNPGQLLRAIFLFTLFTIAAAVFPALRAARLQPITAIHRVG